MRVTTDDIYTWDECKLRLHNISRYRASQVSLPDALYRALDEGLRTGRAESASTLMMKIAGNPGLAIDSSNIYNIVRHHASLMELISHYLLVTNAPDDEDKSQRWRKHAAIDLAPDVIFEPLSYRQGPTHLRRVIITSTWNRDRELFERQSWRSLADIVATGKPMIVNVIIIKPSRQNGMRPSYWTQAFMHPQNLHARIAPLPQQNDKGQMFRPEFNKNWRTEFRESRGTSCAEWLQMMAEDEVMDDVIATFTIPVPPNADALRSQLIEMAKEISPVINAESLPPVRFSGCFHGVNPCPFLRSCREDVNPVQTGAFVRRR